MSLRLGNSGSPRWYTGPDHSFAGYLDHLTQWCSTSAEIVLHHGPYDERTARVHVIDPDWAVTVAGYQEHGIDVQLHVGLDRRFASSRWRDDRDGLRNEFEPILALAATIADRQEQIALVVHGASDTSASCEANDDATVGLLDWLASAFVTESLPVTAALELGAAKENLQTASARSRASVMEIVRRVGSDRVGICWDLAHDRENAGSEPDWDVVPDDEFLRRVVHVHLHDLGDDGLAHYPLVLGNVPFGAQLSALSAIGPLPSLTMEVRWLCATRMGEPWSMLGKSYEAVYDVLANLSLGEREPNRAP